MIDRELFFESFKKQYINNAADFIYDWTDLFTDISTGKKHELYPMQVNFMNFLMPEHRIVVVLKPRQCGISTSIVGKALHSAVFTRVPEIGIISATKNQAVKILRRIKESIDAMTDIVRPKLIVDNAQHIQFANKVNIYSLSSNPRNARGWTGEFFLDEFAIHSESDSEKIYGAVYPSITSNDQARIVAVSTPLGKTGMFYKLATMSLAEIAGREVGGNLKKLLVDIKWTDVPHIVSAQKKGLFDGMPEEILRQEYFGEFLDDIEFNFFTHEFLLANYLVKLDDEEIDTEHLKTGSTTDSKQKLPNIAHDYESLGMKVYDAYLDDLEMPLAEVDSKGWNLRHEYTDVQAGWDIADVNDDSIFVVNGLHKKTGIRHILGEFLLNRKGGSTKEPLIGFCDSLPEQVKYVKRIINYMQIEKVSLDAHSFGRSTFQQLEYEYRNNEDVEIRPFPFSSNPEKLVQAFINLKQHMLENKIKRHYEGDKYCNEFIRQLKNIRIKQDVLGNASISKANASNSKSIQHRNDYAYALLISLFDTLDDSISYGTGLSSVSVLVKETSDGEPVREFTLEEIENGDFDPDEINFANFGQFAQYSKQMLEVNNGENSIHIVNQNLDHILKKND